MSKPETFAFYVNLSASQARKRLKGHGFGVKKVEAADRNQCVILHTATGDHFRGLQSLFADVMSSHCHNDLDVPVENMKNLGSSIAAWLRGIGVRSRDDLQRLGAVAVFRLVKAAKPEIGVQLLWALAAALQDRDVQQLSDDEKSDLEAELDR